jgi:glyoxylase I family protein
MKSGPTGQGAVMTTPTESPVARPSGISHLRLTVTDIARSKAFYTALVGAEPAIDFTDQIDDEQARQDPARFFAGCAFQVGDNIVGLRPGAGATDRFDATRVGLDHVSLAVGSVAELEAAVRRLDELGVRHGEVHELEGLGMTILSLQDPDDVNLELTAPTG